MFTYLQNVVQLGPDSGLGYNSIGNIAGILLNVAVGIGISLAVIFLAFAGIQYMSSGGDPKATDIARNSIKNAVIALVLSLGALTVKAIVLNLFGAQGVDLTNAVPTF
jgi:riboflavin transporter FmnP